MKVDCINSNREWCLFLCEGGWNSRALKNTYDQELQLCILQEFTFFDRFKLVALTHMSVEFTESHDCIEEQCAHRAGVFLCQLLITCHC